VGFSDKKPTKPEFKISKKGNYQMEYNYLAFDEEEQLAVPCRILGRIGFNMARSGDFIVLTPDGERLQVEEKYLYVSVDKKSRRDFENLMKYGG
jgi:predicted ester cyclase